MKKIVSSVAVVGTQVLIGSLFLVMLFSGKPEDDMVVVVKNNNTNKMSDVVTTLFLDDKAKEEPVVDTSVVEELKTDTPVEEEKPEEVVEPEVVEEPKEETPAPDEPVVADNSQVSEPVSTVDTSSSEVMATYNGSLTGYGPDCNGCSGFTSSGHNANESSTYDDYQYGNVRILAADDSIPLYSIIRVTIPGQDSFVGIVLDRGGNVGFGKGTLFDLLFATESQAMAKTDNVLFERLR